MPSVVLILDRVRTKITAASHAIEIAKERESDLLVLTVLDPVFDRRFASRLHDSGQIGPRPSESVLDSLADRHAQLALQYAEDIVSEARHAGLESSTVVKRGSHERQIADALAEISPDVVVIEKRRRSWFGYPKNAAFLDAVQSRVGFELVEV